MKILINKPDTSAWFYIYRGYFNAFKALGYDVSYYGGNINLWRGFKPDLYMASREFGYRIPDRHKAKIIYHVNPFGVNNIVDEPNSTVKAVKRISPNLLWCKSCCMLQPLAL